MSFFSGPLGFKPRQSPVLRWSQQDFGVRSYTADERAGDEMRWEDVGDAVVVAGWRSRADGMGEDMQVGERDVGAK